MSPEILIIREGEGYRLLHGHLHLAGALGKSSEVLVNVKDEGNVKIIKTPTGFFVGYGNQNFPLRRN